MIYIVNKNAQIGTGYHKIHTKNCKRRPKDKNCISLNECICSTEAKIRASEHFENVSGCQYCCKEICYKK